MNNNFTNGLLAVLGTASIAAIGCLGICAEVNMAQEFSTAKVVAVETVAGTFAVPANTAAVACYGGVKIGDSTVRVSNTNIAVALATAINSNGYSAVSRAIAGIRGYRLTLRNEQGRTTTVGTLQAV